MLELAAFLGNPGAGYKGNRHNAGWLLAQNLPFFDALGWRKKFKGLWADMEGARLVSLGSPSPDFGEYQEPESQNPPALPQKIHFLMPETYMNRSGDSIYEAAAFFKIKPERIILIHDELELPLGTVSLKFSGGLGGHNGLRSMKGNFGTADFWRLRIGIGRPGDREPGQGGREGSGRGIVEWVLSDFGPEEVSVLGPVLKTAGDLLHRILVVGPENFLPFWNKRKVV